MKPATLALTLAALGPLGPLPGGMPWTPEGPPAPSVPRTHDPLAAAIEKRARKNAARLRRCKVAP